jgi:hypothetical protein
MEISIFAFEVNVASVREGLFEGGGAFSKPKAPTVDKLSTGLGFVWRPVVSNLASALGDGSFIRYFYTAELKEASDRNQTAVNNSFVWSALSGPRESGLSDPRVFPFSDMDDKFVISQVRQILQNREESTKLEIGVLFVTDMARARAEEVFKEVYLEFSMKQKGELHLFNFSSNGLLNVSLANIPDGALSGSLAGEAGSRTRVDELNSNNVTRFLSQLDIGPTDEGLSAQAYRVLTGDTSGPAAAPSSPQGASETTGMAEAHPVGQLTISEFTTDGPDSDGDYSFSLSAETTNDTTYDIEKIRTSSTLLTEGGAGLMSSGDEEELYAEPGETFELTPRLSWLRDPSGKLIGGSGGLKAVVSATLLRKATKQLGSYPIPESEGVTVIDETFDLDGRAEAYGLVLKRLAPDEDGGGTNIEVECVVQNTKNVFFEGAELKAAIVDRNGSTLEEDSAIGLLPPNQSIPLQCSAWGIKAGQLRGAEVKASMSLWIAESTKVGEKTIQITSTENSGSVEAGSLELGQIGGMGKILTDHSPEEKCNLYSLEGTDEVFIDKLSDLGVWNLEKGKSLSFGTYKNTFVCEKMDERKIEDDCSEIEKLIKANFYDNETSVYLKHVRHQNIWAD